MIHSSTGYAAHDPAKDVSDVMRSRRTVRAFRDQPVARELVEEVLRDAAAAPSGANMQPWRVYVVAGTVKDMLCAAVLAAARGGKGLPPAHLPEPLPEVFRSRMADFGARYYRSLGIERSDVQARAGQTERNYFFFGAPVGLIFSIDRRLKPHSWIDLGLFAQGLMLSAKARGLDTCPQVSFAPFHETISSVLGMPSEEVTVFGMSLGYGDLNAAVNRTEMPRQPPESFARLLGFPT
ncbi:nitroreductase [Variovorax sp. J31P207]|uniref:nitroreductase n=1 Tax=Variovorax sp. J31P207 TaxID=3053510 RepID=UPI002574FE0E|nr:nitroreductase [Variovorax sp. J31P207]MDM0065370.1 nitroreductase [Variovorax sp. J31P207]